MDELPNAITYLENAGNKLVSLREKFANILGLLNTNEWQGESKQKCLELHNAIRAYERKLKPCCENMKKHCDELTDLRSKGNKFVSNKNP
ncbi:MAG: hypothetical protein FWC09_05100 [Lachnospiraceae bacterium]|nr:hypothetical protein [Lachnospiraceae bacterium]